jgi:MarR family transcriptional regulator, organic hydroperoxide resistance regulator
MLTNGKKTERLGTMASIAAGDEVEARSAAEEAWGRLVGLVWLRRPQWLAAGAAEGLTPPHAMVLMKLRDHDPPLLGEIARDLQCDASYATALADRLEERGLATRRPSPRDRRAKELVLTDAGRDVQARLRAAFRTPPPAFGELSEDELGTLLAITRRLMPDDAATDWLIGPR